MDIQDRLDKINDKLTTIQVDVAVIKTNLKRVDWIEDELKPISFRVKAISWLLGIAIIASPAILKWIGFFNETQNQGP